MIICLYSEVLGIDLPSYDGCSAERIDQERHAWQTVPLGAEQFGDVVVFWTTRPGRGEHVGFVIEPGKMLHCVENTDSSIGWYDSSFRGRMWRPRLVGLHRWLFISPSSL